MSYTLTVPTKVRQWIDFKFLITLLFWKGGEKNNLQDWKWAGDKGRPQFDRLLETSKEHFKNTEMKTTTKNQLISKRKRFNIVKTNTNRIEIYIACLTYTDCMCIELNVWFCLMKQMKPKPTTFTEQVE